MTVCRGAIACTRKRSIPVLCMFIIACLMFYISDTSELTGQLSRLFSYPANISRGSRSGDLDVIHPQKTPSKDEIHDISRKPSAAPSHAPQSSHSDDRVFLAMKTGYSRLYGRLPLHLITTLSNWPPDNLAIYSDLPDKIGRYSVIDVFENITKPPALFRQYNTLREIQRKKDFLKSCVYHFRDNIDGSKDGWALDRFKFLPMIDHVQKNWPDMDWYIFMEEDSFLFLDNVVKYLQNLDANELHYLGGLGLMHGGTFAHGGSGYVLSRGALDASFRKNPNLVQDYEEMTESHHWGDEVLGEVLTEYGLSLNGDGSWKWGWQAEAHWNTNFIASSVCTPLFSFHHVEAHEITDYWDFSVAFNAHSKSPMRYFDFFTHFIRPYISRPVSYWDNLSAEHVITSTHNSTLTPNSEAWQSLERCEEACKAWKDCLQWVFKEDHCGLETNIRLGKTTHVIEEDPAWLHHCTSGWMLERIDQIWDDTWC